MTNYVSATDTNKLIRAALRESFPGVKFSVRKTPGGSCRIQWTDGPNAKQVDSLLSAFEGSYVDGMIDYKGQRYAWLDGKEAHFLVDFIFTDREYSRETEFRAIRRTCHEYAHQCEYLANTPPSQIYDDWKSGKLYNVYPCGGGWDMSHSLQSMLNERCGKHTFCPFPAPSKTLARVSFKGSDGYGAGQPDRDGNGHGYGGYPRPERMGA